MFLNIDSNTYKYNDNILQMYPFGKGFYIFASQTLTAKPWWTELVEILPCWMGYVPDS